MRKAGKEERDLIWNPGNHEKYDASSGLIHPNFNLPAFLLS
jgi:hypothetical protein